MHKALYRKWRPQVFEDVVGQDYIVAVLKNQVAAGKIGHAYLFTGSRGTGKTTCAKIFSRAVNCLQPQNGDPCGSCEICGEILSGAATDVVEIDAASHTGVDNIRDIIEESAFLPVLCRYRVYIIDEAHMLSQSAFNALLKIMEEPPEHVIFILATTEVHQIPVTVISRCQRFDFQRIRDEEIRARLLQVAAAEQIVLEEDAAAVIAALADGGMRDALSLFDQCASYDNHVTCESVSKVSGQADHAFVDALLQAVCDGDTAQALHHSAAAHQRSLSVSYILAEMIAGFRDAMILKSVGEQAPELFSAGSDLALAGKLAAKMSLAEILNCLDILSDALNTLGRSAYPQILFEQSLIRLCTAPAGADPAGLSAKVQALEKRLGTVPANFSPFSAPATKSDEKKLPEPHAAKAVKQKTPGDGQTPAPSEKSRLKNNAEAPAGDPAGQSRETAAKTAASSADGAEDGALIAFELWPQVLELLSKSNPPLCGSLRSAKAYLGGDVVYIDTNDFTFSLLKGSEHNRTTLKAAIAQAAGRPLLCAQYKEKAARPAAGSAMEEILKRARRNGVDVSES